jgi:hypothetical protein
MADRPRSARLNPPGFSGDRVTGDSYRNFVTRDIATIAYSNAGVPLWTNRHNGPANGDDVPLTKQSLAHGPGGSVYVAGASNGNSSDGQFLNFVTII